MGSHAASARVIGSCSMCRMCSLANSRTLSLPYLALCQSIYLAMLNPLESTNRVSCTASPPAHLGYDPLQYCGVYLRYAELAGRIKAGTRGFDSDDPGLPPLHVAYHNFLRPHSGICGMTPAEEAGIHVPGPDKLLTPIRCAAAARFAFT